MGHVDHAHHAKGDGQTDGRQQQDRAQAQTEKQVFNEAVERDAALDRVECILRLGSQFRVGIVVGHVGQGVACFAFK